MLIAASVILAAFLGTTGIILERSFSSSAEEALKERLQAHSVVLIASSDIDVRTGQLNLLHALPEVRFFAENSGLYAKILSNSGQVLWKSPSLGDMPLPVEAGMERGKSRYQKLTSSDGFPVMSYRLGVTWGDDVPVNEGYTFIVAESMVRYEQQLLAFRQSLWGWLSGVALVLLVMLALILRWGLSPLRRVAADLADIEQGRCLELHGEYPRELRGLTDNLNSLIRSNREHEERYRASLGDLAHSLKTPLAVLRGVVDASRSNSESICTTVDEQVERMNQIVLYQLQHAATSGRTALLAPVALDHLMDKVLNALRKVYADKNVQCDAQISLDMPFRCDEGDLMELLGNLIDNAFKWCSARVIVQVTDVIEGDSKYIEIVVMDDGPGIGKSDVATALARGGRLDSDVSGHGLGLAMVKNVVELYGGKLEIGQSDLGGARVAVLLPWR